VGPEAKTKISSIRACVQKSADMINRTASITFRVECECEACQHRYSWNYTLTKNTSSAYYGYARDPTPGLMKQVTGAFKDMKFGVIRCPKCRYLQSWMKTQWVERNEGWASLLAFPILFYLGRYLHWPWPSRSLVDLGDLIVFALAALCYLIVLAVLMTPFAWVARKLSTSPNASWHRSHGPDVPPPRSPSITPVPKN
jgi:hypothetical protein